MKKTVMTTILTILLFMTMISVVGCKADKEPVMTNDLLHRETNEITETSVISQYL